MTWVNFDQKRQLVGNGPLAVSNSSSSQQQIQNDLDNKKFAFKDFIIPGWTGDGLLTKNALLIKKCYQTLTDDACKKFVTFNTLNKSLKLAIYNDFLSFVNSQNFKCYEIDNFTVFWNHIQDENSPYKKELELFIREFCFRAVNVYLFRLKFVIAIGNATAIDISINNLLNPTSFITKIFPKGGVRELYCESLQTNQYSWYRPESSFDDLIIKLSTLLPELSITEIIKLSTPVAAMSGNQLPDSLEYSHSISHKSFGLFINELLLFFPNWLNKKNSETKTSKQSHEGPNVLNCKFTGNNLTSFILSHWLAQEEDIDKIWKEIICPDFYNDDASNGQYVKICHELQFLEYLVKIARHQNYRPIEFICDIINEKYRSFYENPNGQTWFFSSAEAKNDIYYSRIVLNLAQLPTKNPHHYLLTQINNQKKSLVANGLIYVFSNQKLFLPSHSDKIESFLKEMKIEAFFDFDGFKGKGEIPNYLYIFSNREQVGAHNNQEIIPQLQTVKESCFHFKISGELPIFQNFTSVVNELQSFFSSKNSMTTSIYQKEISELITFEFYQDAIVDGKLLHSSSNDPQKITHPQFFKNLTKSCCPLDNFFIIENIQGSDSSFRDKHLITSGFLGVTIRPEERFPIILIINRTNSTNTKIELISSDAYNATLEKYGVALYHYFGLKPKQSDLNINVFREFFNSNIGSQIIQLTLSGAVTKLKSKLNAMLIPKFLGSNEEIPAHIEESISLLKTPLSQILTMHPESLKNSFSLILPQINSLANQFPARIMGLVSYFKINLQNGLQHFDGKQKYINYNNPVIVGPLVKLKSYPIFPKHNDIFIKFLPEGSKYINTQLSNIVIKQDDENNLYIEVYSANIPVLQIYSGPIMISFLEFILNSAIGSSISKILQGLQVPTAEDLNSVLANFNQLAKALEEIYNQTENILSTIIIKSISTPQ